MLVDSSTLLIAPICKWFAHAVATDRGSSKRLASSEKAGIPVSKDISLHLLYHGLMIFFYLSVRSVSASSLSPPDLTISEKKPKHG